ncbi:MAG TPA: sigma-E factor regulatory protein RseB domain-containing protein [Trinickia sp.]|jgi:outer membrane lipoprotein-sorting protein|nr:sigma-E factor regulatory protein RseB domain-containing protein [Trinickia sp.]
MRRPSAAARGCSGNAIGNEAGADLIDGAEARFNALENYEVTLRSTPANGEPFECGYCYRKPGWIRMDFVRPHAGAVLSYNPETGKLLLWPFGFHTFPKLTLGLDHPLIQGPQGHRIERTDLGSLLANVRQLGASGSARVIGDESVGERAARHVVVEGGPGCAVSGVHRYRLWLDETTGLPIKVVSEDEHGETIETVVMDDLRVDVQEPKPFV